jgi:AcrR family transcriptional regulator
MARVRADDYEDKQRFIADAAASLFAKSGYPHSSLIDIGKKCGASKANVYHYFKSKDQILYQILEQYCQFVLQTFESIDGSLPPEQRLRIFLQDFIQRPPNMKNRHVVLLNDLKYLPLRLRKQIVSLERRLLQHMVTLLKQVQRVKQIDDKVLRTYVLLLFGSINGIDIWYNPRGLMSSEELAKRVCRLFIDGICKTP